MAGAKLLDALRGLVAGLGSDAGLPNDGGNAGGSSSDLPFMLSEDTDSDFASRAEELSARVVRRRRDLLLGDAATAAFDFRVSS